MSSPRRLGRQNGHSQSKGAVEDLFEFELGPLAKASPFAEEGTETLSLALGELSPQPKAASLPAAPRLLSEDRNSLKRPAEAEKVKCVQRRQSPVSFRRGGLWCLGGQGFAVGLGTHRPFIKQVFNALAMLLWALGTRL